MSVHDSEDRLLDDLGVEARRQREEVDMDALEADPIFGALTPAEQRGLADSVLARAGIEAQGEVAQPVVRELASRRLRVALLAGSALAIAAGVLLWVFARPQETLPSYDLVLPPSDAEVRGDGTNDSGTYSTGRELEIVLRPSTRTDAELHVSAFVRRGEVWRRWSPRSSPLEGGTWLVTATLGEELDVGEGTWRLLFVVSTEPIEDATALPESARRVERQITVVASPSAQ